MSAEDYWPEQRTVVLLFGGRSSEHGVSCVTAAGVLNAIDRDRFNVILVGITKRGANVLVREEDVAGFALNPAGLPEIAENGTRVLWPASVEARTLSVIDSRGDITSLGRIDVVIPLLHGPFGEDGTVQGMLELVGVPYVGSGVLSSALCMDKHAVKTLLAQAGISVAPWHMVTRTEFDRDPALVSRLDAGLSYPLFVKPNRAGSSMGVSRIVSPDELPAALETAFAEDSMVLIETGIAGRELEIAVLGGRDGAPPRASAVVGEIVYTGSTLR